MNRRIPLYVVFLLMVSRAVASFHLMQIEQVIGGIDGDATAQAVQLRMRAASQNAVSVARVRAFDAAGANPVTIIDFTTNVPNATSGDRILIASAKFKQLYPSANPDFTQAALIPPSYLAAGRLTFEQDDGTVYWSLAWGGAGYTGSNSGALDNDADGNFGPPFANALPSSGKTALAFTGLTSDPSTSNAAQYAVTAGPAVVRNNARQSTSLSTSPAVLVYQGNVTMTANTSANTPLTRPGRAFVVLDTGTSRVRLVQTFRGNSGQHQISFVDDVLQPVTTKGGRLINYFRSDVEGAIGTPGYAVAFDDFAGPLRSLRVATGAAPVTGPLNLVGTLERRDSTVGELLSLKARVSVQFSGNRTVNANTGGQSAETVFEAIKDQLANQGFSEVTVLD